MTLINIRDELKYNEINQYINCGSFSSFEAIYRINSFDLKK